VKEQLHLVIDPKIMLAVLAIAGAYYMHKFFNACMKPTTKDKAAQTEPTVVTKIDERELHKYTLDALREMLRSGYRSTSGTKTEAVERVIAMQRAAHPLPSPSES